MSFMMLILNYPLMTQTDSIKLLPSEWEAFPIVTYDHDAGFGYGGKLFLFNQLGRGESFDVILFNSTKGERWYRLVVSYPDNERRHCKDYPFALDVILDYDKWNSYRYYASGENNYEVYSREPIELSIILSRTFVKELVTKVGLKFKNISCYNFDESRTLKSISPTEVKSLSVLLIGRWDCRNSLINPTEGYLIQIDFESAFKNNYFNQEFFRTALTVQYYLPLFKPQLIIAGRTIIQNISDVQYQMKLPLGGNNTIRGLPQDRYLSLTNLLINTEFRFPILWRLGGAAGIDAGKILRDSFFNGEWIINPVLGLRFYLENFVVRFDAGFSNDNIGIYFNFGHVF